MLEKSRKVDFNLTSFCSLRRGSIADDGIFSGAARGRCYLEVADHYRSELDEPAVTGGHGGDGGGGGADAQGVPPAGGGPAGGGDRGGGPGGGGGLPRGLSAGVSGAAGGADARAGAGGLLRRRPGGHHPADLRRGLRVRADAPARGDLLQRARRLPDRRHGGHLRCPAPRLGRPGEAPGSLRALAVKGIPPRWMMGADRSCSFDPKRKKTR